MAAILFPCGPAGSVNLAPTSSWTPADLGFALRLWVKADTGITSSGGLITQANDQSGNGFHLVSSGSVRPTLNATGYNSLPSIDFTASSGTVMGTQALGGAVPVALNLGTSCSFFFIGRYSTASDNFGRIMSYLGPATIVAVGTGVDYNTADSLACLHRNGALSELQGTQNSANLAIGAVSPSTNIRVLMVYSGAANTATLYVNNVQITQTTGVAAFDLGTTGVLAVGTTIQASSGTIGTLAASFTGTIAEALVTNTALNSTERGNLDTYVVARLGA